MQEGRSGEELVAQFTRWAAAQRAAEAVDRRTRERSLRDQAVGSATWTGLVVDLAERSAPVVMMVGAHRRRGRLVGVGQGFCVLEQPNGRPALVALGAIAALAPDQAGPSAAGAPSGNREPELRLSLAAALAALAEERSPVVVVLAGGHQESGQLIAAGEDVLTLRTDGAAGTSGGGGAGVAGVAARRLVHVPVRAVLVCELR